MKMLSRWVCGYLLSTLFVASAYAQQYDGTLQWSKRAVLGTLSSGVVLNVLVDVGDKVKQGELLLQLDPAVFKKRVEQTKINQQSAQQNYQEAEREKDRAEELYTRTVLSEHDLQLAKNNYIKAKSDYEKARLQHEQAKYDFKYSQIKAPFDAIVLARHIQPGEVVKTELKPIPMLSVAQSDRMRVRVLVAESELASITMRQSAIVNVSGGTYDGEVVAIAFEPVDVKGSQRYPVDIEFVTGSKLLRAGLSAEVEIK